MNVVHGRNRNSGPVAISALVGIATDKAASRARVISRNNDNDPQLRVRTIHEHVMLRILTEHGYAIVETVVPTDGLRMAQYVPEANEAGGTHLLMMRQPRTRSHSWAVLEGNEYVDGDHHAPVAIPPYVGAWRLLRAYHVQATEDVTTVKHVSRRRWTEEEDAAIRLAAAHNAFNGLTDDEHQYSNRLRTVARELNRTYASVRVRASRIDAVSYSVKRQGRICE